MGNHEQRRGERQEPPLLMQLMQRMTNAASRTHVAQRMRIRRALREKRAPPASSSESANGAEKGDSYGAIEMDWFLCSRELKVMR